MGDFPHKDPTKVRFERPALFVRGTKSKYVPDEALPVVGEFFPLFEVADIDAGHWVISESPEAFRQGECFLLGLDIWSVLSSSGSANEVSSRR